MSPEMKTALTIAGSDCSGGAGIQADLKTFAAHGVFGMSVIVSVVAENTCRVIAVENVSPGMIGRQLDAVFEDIPPDAVKIGMLSTPAAMEAVAEKLDLYRPAWVVADPVMYAKNGAPLMESGAVDSLIRLIVPRAGLLTPNIPEAEKIARREIHGMADMEEAARIIAGLGARRVLIKGGHSEGDAVDLLFDGESFARFSSARIPSRHTHGTGCTFSSAITAGLARGLPLPEAVEKAKAYITTAIERAPGLGRGHGPTHHFYDLYRRGGLA